MRPSQHATRRILSLALVFLLASCSTHKLEPQPFVNAAPTVNSGSITYIGIESSTPGVEAFLGIPFAQAPVGTLRWSTPRMLKPSSNVPQIIDASNFQPACMQGPHISNWYKGVIESFGADAKTFPTPLVSEDCLYLNIWRPKTENKSPLPVFVFIHGGSNKGGWAYEPNYIGERLAAQGAIVVTIAYRLGVFGFFSHPDLQRANFALLDQIAALSWLKENVSAVGGDPNNITIAGESAGASNIAYLMAAPTARGLFQRAIHQSAGWAMYRTQLKEDADALGLKFAAAVSGLATASISDLRDISSEAVLEVSEQVYAGHFFDPVIDQDTVLKPLHEAVNAGELTQVDLMIGSNANESRMYLPAQISVESWLQDNQPSVSLSAIDNVLSNDDYDNELAKVDHLATGFNYTCPSLSLARANAKGSGQTWVYYFDKVRDGELARKMGAYHGAELPYVFNTHDDWLPTSEHDIRLSEAMVQYWLNFANSGNPNTLRSSVHASRPAWPEYQHAADEVQFLGVDIRSATHPSYQLCKILEQKIDSE